MDEPRRLSILIPVYNEEDSIFTLLERVLAASLPDNMRRELIVVDDGSKDESVKIAGEFVERYPEIVRLVVHSHNQGKSAAIRTAIKRATGEFCIIQDADLELDPREYERVLKPLLQGVADAVYGSRFSTAGERQVLHFWHSAGNRLLTTLCNMLSDLDLTDMETCYKAFRTSLLRSIPIRSKRFGIEPELTIKLAQRQARIYETPISYHGRTYQEGKKIRFADALEAVYVMLKTKLARDAFKDRGREMFEALLSAPNLNRWIAGAIQPYLGCEVMEIGAGVGTLTNILISRAKRYIVSDSDEGYLAILRTRFQHRRNAEIRYAGLGEPESFKPVAGQADTVVCLNGLERVEDDLAALHAIHSVLRPGGRAIILAPHGQEFFGTLDTALGRRRRYSEAQLREIMERAGFQLERVLMFNRVSRPAWYIWGKILKKSSLRWRGIRRFDRFVWLWRKLDAVLPWSGTSLIAIGVKQ